MEFGIAVPAGADSWKVVQRAEKLGFTCAWFYDTQMLCADCFVAMAAAAVKTSRIHLGTGVVIPSNRIAPVTANALASLNALAPGRIDFGVGTGFTARRAMGLGAMKLADMEEHIHVVLALLRGETPELAIEGKQRRVRFLNPELGLINIRDPIRLHISAYGPRSRALTAKLAAGWMNFIPSADSGIADLREMQQARHSAGRNAADLAAAAFAVGCVLSEREPCDSPRALAQAGPRAALLLHRPADASLEGLPNTSRVPPNVSSEVSGYLEVARKFEPGARYLQNHRGHLLFVKPEERPFVTAELIRQTTFTATEPVLTEQIAALRDAGYTQFAIQVVPGQEAAIEDWARIMRALGTHH
jgi:5,10-methylenetetrahydromethanopterin reductase